MYTYCDVFHCTFLCFPRPMRVPDKITLEAGGAPVAEPGEPSEGHTHWEAEPTWSRTGAVPAELRRGRAEDQGGPVPHANIHAAQQ